MLFVKHFFALAGKTGCRGQKRETPGGPLGPPGVVVRAWGLEPQRIAAREPKSRMSTNSIMPAYKSDRYILPLYLIVSCLQEKELKRSIPPALR